MKILIVVSIIFFSINSFSSQCEDSVFKNPSPQDEIQEAVKLAHVGANLRKIEPKMNQLKVLNDQLQSIPKDHPDYPRLVEEILNARKDAEDNYKVILDFFISKNFNVNRINHIFRFENSQFFLNNISKDSFSENKVTFEFIQKDDPNHTRVLSQWQISFKLLEEIFMYHNQ